MAERFAELTGFVLMGGASRRMGQPKHQLIFEGETLLTRAARKLRSVAGRVYLLGAPDRARGLDLLALPDDLPGSGPLGAIYTGLLHTRTEFNLFLSCDVPFMQARFLRHLARRALDSLADVTLAATPRHGYQPLCAVYRRRALPAVRRSLAAGRRKVASFFPTVQVRVLLWPELDRAGFRRIIFDNLNTPADYVGALKRVHYQVYRER
ncbi:MAG TPA: molybdenum cofactor guanylyltransferase [Terriglobia bacterium]|nr:molybdenum cofactor guanylyltransferase [Terriglobia bacterium]